MICPKCGAPVSANMTQCPYCGGQLGRPVVSHTEEETQMASASQEACYATAPSDQTEFAGNSMPLESPQTQTESLAWMHHSATPAPASQSPEVPQKTPKKAKDPKAAKAKKSKRPKKSGEETEPNNTLRIVLLVILAVLIVVLILR